MRFEFGLIFVTFSLLVVFVAPLLFSPPEQVNILPGLSDHPTSDENNGKAAPVQKQKRKTFEYQFGKIFPKNQPEQKPAVRAKSGPVQLPQLLGISNASGQLVAYFQLTQNGAPIKTQTGEKIGGYTIRFIDTNGAILFDRTTKIDHFIPLRGPGESR